MGRDRVRCAISDDLTDKQKLAIELLATGNPVGETADAVGVTRRTLHNWRTKDRAYQLAYKEAMGDAELVSVREARAKLAEIYSKATVWLEQWFDDATRNLEPNVENMKHVTPLLEFLRKATEGGAEKTTIKKNLTVNQKVDLPRNTAAVVKEGKLRIIESEEEPEEIQAEVIDASAD